ncbi:hypothetical protein [Flavobacterium agrisoli]|nr:hypothetical protein [Flavobacterium agrisoli]
MKQGFLLVSDSGLKPAIYCSTLVMRKKGINPKSWGGIEDFLT